MKNRLLIGAALTASLLLSACGGDTTGTATTSSTTSSTSATSSSSSATTSESMESMDSSAMETMETSSDDASSTVTPVTLDEQSVAWFSSFCASNSKMEQSGQSMESMQPDASASPADQQAAITSSIKSVGEIFKTGSADIAAVPPATVEGGTEFAAAATGAFDKIGDEFIAAADKFAATPVTDAATLQAAQTTLGTDVQGALTAVGETLEPLKSFFTPELTAAVREIPGCEDIANS